MIYSQNWLFELILWVIPTFLAIRWRESAKAWACHFRGDSGPKMQGYTSLNPFKKLDPIGSIIAPFILILRQQPVFAWAHRFEVRASFMKNGLSDVILVVAAGILSNLAMAIAWHWIGHFNDQLIGIKFLHDIINYMVIDGVHINCILMVIHLIPIAPLDASAIISNMLPKFLKSIYELTTHIGMYVITLLMLSQHFEQELITIMNDLTEFTLILAKI